MAVIWARGKVVSYSCPISYVTPQSLAWLEEYEAWKMSPGGLLAALPARQAEAFWILKTEWQRESHEER